MKLTWKEKQYKAVSLVVCEKMLPAIIEYINDEKPIIKDIVKKHDIDQRVFLRWKNDWLSDDVVLYLNEKSKQQLKQEKKKWPISYAYFKKYMEA